jgi:hypothetical protein
LRKKEECYDSMKTGCQEGGEDRGVPKVVVGERRSIKTIFWRPKEKFCCAQERR